MPFPMSRVGPTPLPDHALSIVMQRSPNAGTHLSHSPSRCPRECGDPSPFAHLLSSGMRAGLKTHPLSPTHRLNRSCKGRGRFETCLLPLTAPPHVHGRPPYPVGEVREPPVKPSLPLPVSSRMRGPIPHFRLHVTPNIAPSPPHVIHIATCHSERSAAESKNLAPTASLVTSPFKPALPTHIGEWRNRCLSIGTHSNSGCATI